MSKRFEGNNKLLQECNNIIKEQLNSVVLICPCPTKRQLLSFIVSIYDPLGLINPFTFRLKVLFHDVQRKVRLE